MSVVRIIVFNNYQKCVLPGFDDVTPDVSEPVMPGVNDTPVTEEPKLPEENTAEDAIIPGLDDTSSDDNIIP